MKSKYFNKTDARNYDWRKVPKTIRDAVAITQEDKKVLLDRAVSLAQFLSERDWTTTGAWEIVQAYNNFLFDRIDILKKKVVHLQESNDFLRDEKFLLTYNNAEYIFNLKNHNIDVERIQRDARKKLEERKSAIRKSMEEQNPLAEIEIT